MRTIIIFLFSIGISFSQNIRVKLNEEEEKIFLTLFKNRVIQEVSTGNPSLYFLTKMNDYNYISATDLYNVFESNEARGEALIDSTKNIVISGNIKSISTMSSPLKSYKDNKVAIINLSTSQSGNDLKFPIAFLMINPDYLETAINLNTGDYMSIICHSNAKDINNTPIQIMFKNCRDIEMYADQYTIGNAKLILYALDKYFYDIPENHANHLFTPSSSYFVAKFLYYINTNEDITKKDMNSINDDWNKMIFNDTEDFEFFLKQLNLPNSQKHL